LQRINYRNHPTYLADFISQTRSSLPQLSHFLFPDEDVIDFDDKFAEKAVIEVEEIEEEEVIEEAEDVEEADRAVSEEEVEEGEEATVEDDDESEQVILRVIK
jgi:hypothetical protein